ncbi:hypothetical protein L1987_02598 [Smallanthus sonchifolius]|uniref:Uncharacterized protein n=1 Tax=Smallanthus sonchifolius TaxID=185202 RepID=A0ACB9K880_9ASTR|nr:hypothetical protein L1987_02598 [Smallanthus sonchifolius]
MGHCSSKGDGKDAGSKPQRQDPTPEPTVSGRYGVAVAGGVAEEDVQMVVSASVAGETDHVGYTETAEDEEGKAGGDTGGRREEGRDADG